MELFQRLEVQTTANKWFLPLVWAARLVGRATEDGMIVPPAASAVMGEVATLTQKDSANFSGGQNPGAVAAAAELRLAGRAAGLQPDRHPRCLLLLHCRALRGPVGQPHLQASLRQARHVLPHLHNAPVRLLRRLAQGGRDADQSIWRGR